MKYIKNYKIYESMTSLPIERYPIDYECTHIYDIAENLKSKYKLDVYNIKPHTPTKNAVHDFNLYDFIDKKIQTENTIFPKLRLHDIYKNPRSKEYTDPGSVILLPKYYDSSDDERLHDEYVKKGKNSLIKSFKELFKGDDKKLKDAIENIDKHINFGVSNYEWVNVALDKIYEEYKQYFIGDYLRVWSPYDNDTNNSFEDSNESTVHGHPIEKMLHLSDVEKYLESNYNLSDDLFYQFIVKNNYVENRYWEKPLHISFENMKFSRGDDKYGMIATPTIDKMLSILEMEYKDLMNKVEPGWGFPIYIDYYKKIEEEE